MNYAAAVTPFDAPDPDDRAEMLRISGRVQGVGFRASAQDLALQHGLRGWVANVGRGVVIHACGAGERLEAFVQALRTDIGPPARIREQFQKWKNSGATTIIVGARQIEAIRLMAELVA